VTWSAVPASFSWIFRRLDRGSFVDELLGRFFVVSCDFIPELLWIIFLLLIGLDSQPDECHDFVDLVICRVFWVCIVPENGLFSVVLADYCLDVVGV